jgi:predicted ATPase/class 3 adenylate cyclase
MSILPSGTVTFLFTDIEGSTRLWQEKPQAMAISNARHNVIVREGIESNHGTVFQLVGDSFAAAFGNAVDALYAALSAQRGLQAEEWGLTGSVRVRMGLHTGAAEISSVEPNKYSKGYATIASAQRVMSAGHGGQVLLSQTTHDLLQNELPAGVTLRDLGEHRLKDLRSPVHIYQMVASDLPQEFPPIKTLDTFPNNLPVQLTSFIGREKELGEIKNLLNSARLVTLTGSGGTGKTRLALEVSAQELSRYPQGVWLIELAPLTEASQIIPAMAQVFGLQELPMTPLASQVVDYLRDKKVLLILDNCEHLTEVCARLADELLHQCARLKIIASSREALGIAGEMGYRTPSLAETESMQLFVERARAANSRFNLTESNTSSIAQICSRLDGIPLAIELAAARVKLLSPEQIARRLDDRFRLLVGGSRTALPRQQTLRALIDWSYDLLSQEEKHLMEYAAVFIGGWTLEALEAVADDLNAMEHLEQLVNKSLVVTEERESEMRYAMLETIRQYAYEKLFNSGQAAQAHDRHFVYFDSLSELAWDKAHSSDLVVWGLEDEIDNFRTALEWGLEHHLEEIVHLAANTALLVGWLGNQTDARVYVKSALQASDRLSDSLSPVTGEALLLRQRLRARALYICANTEMGPGDNQYALLTLKEAISLSRQTGDKSMLGTSLEMYAIVTSYVGLNDGPAAAEEGLAILREIDDKLGITVAYLVMARIAMERGNLTERQNYMDKALRGLQGSNSSYLAAMSMMALGMTERLLGRYESARDYFEAGLVLFRRMHNKHFVNVMMSELGHIARLTGDFTRAIESYKQTIVHWQELGSRPAVAHQLECFAMIAVAQKQPQRAARLFGSAEVLREKIGSLMKDYERTEYDPALAQLHSLLGEAYLNALWADGRKMTMDQAIQLALT